MKNPLKLRDEARDEAYEYFDSHVRNLDRLLDGKIDPFARGLEDNDVDAFRHAYVSGVFTQEYNEEAADIFGRLNEFFRFSSSSSNSGAENMDMWNNNIGRQLGKSTKSRQELLQKIHRALKAGELIVHPTDSRRYLGATNQFENRLKPIVVLKEEKGRNAVFYDTEKHFILSREQFVTLIGRGDYPGYAVKNIEGVLTPVSNPDGRETNNLG